MSEVTAAAAHVCFISNDGSSLLSHPHSSLVDGPSAMRRPRVRHTLTDTGTVMH